MIVAPLLAATACDRAGPYLSLRLRSLDARLQETADRLLSTVPDSEAVHDLRVALRRMRTLLDIGRRVFGSFYCCEVRGAMRELQEATGALRDAEVVVELVESLRVAHPDVAPWIETRRNYVRRLRGELVRVIKSGKLHHGRRLLDALLAFRIKPSRDRVLGKLALAAVKRAQRRVSRRRKATADDPESLHCLRIAYKRLRYTVEAFTTVLPLDQKELAHSAARFQSRLGAIHDVDVAADSLRRARSLSADAKARLQAALLRRRVECVAAYSNEVAVTAAGRRPDHSVGRDSLRKTSTR